MAQAPAPSGLGLSFTSWRCDPALLICGIATMPGIAYLLLVLLSTRRLTATTLPFAAVLYLVFAASLIRPVTRLT